MKEISINVIAVVAAAGVKFVLGALWYSPLLFLKSWCELTGRSEAAMKQGMGIKIAVDAVGSLVMAFVLAHAVVYAGATTFLQGMAVGFLNWLGFIVVVTSASFVWEGKPFKLFLINHSYILLSLLIMGGLLAVWR